MREALETLVSSPAVSGEAGEAGKAGKAGDDFLVGRTDRLISKVAESIRSWNTGIPECGVLSLFPLGGEIQASLFPLLPVFEEH